MNYNHKNYKKVEEKKHLRGEQQKQEGNTCKWQTGCKLDLQLQ